MAAKARTDLKEALAEFSKLYPPNNGRGWATQFLSDEERALVTDMFKAGHGQTSIARFLRFIGHEDATPGRVETFTETIPRGTK